MELYLAGSFSAVGAQPRTGVAAVSRTTGAPLPFAPVLAPPSGFSLTVFDIDLDDTTRHHHRLAAGRYQHVSTGGRAKTVAQAGAASLMVEVGGRTTPPMNVDAYLSRIRYRDTCSPTAATLRGLHAAHLRAVPFENLDIPLRRRITLTPDALWTKIVESGRGGFCYELNTLFGGLLQALGYPVDFLSARVWGDTGFGPHKDHMALLVRVDGDPWLADVGFGDSFLAPLRLVSDLEHTDGFKRFRLLAEGADWTMQVQEAAGEWKAEYRFDLQAYAPDSFQSMCDYQQTSPESSFTRRAVCSRATDDGRVTVTHDRLIVTRGVARTEAPLADAEAFREALAAHQGITLRSAEAAAIVARFRRVT